MYNEGATVDLATTSIDFVGVGVNAQSTGPGSVQVSVPLIDDYGRRALDTPMNIAAPGLYVIQFDYNWLDPNNRWDIVNDGWNLPVGVYEIGTNVTAYNNPVEYAVRIVNFTNAGQILAIANTTAHQGSDYEHTTHLSTIVQLGDASVIRVEVDIPYSNGCTINSQYIGYAPTDAIQGNRLLTDFWYHKLK